MKNNKQQSSIEWLVNELKTYEIYKPLSLSKWDVLYKLERKAKKMYKEECQSDFIAGIEFITTNPNKYEEAEKYYKRKHRNGK